MSLHSDIILLYLYRKTEKKGEKYSAKWPSKGQQKKDFAEC